MSGIEVGGVYIGVYADTNPYERGLRRVETQGRSTGDVISRQFLRANAGAQTFNQTLRNTASSLGLVAGAAGAVLATKAIIGEADAYKLLIGRIKLVAREGENLNQIEEGLYRTALKNHQSLTATATLYQRLRQSRKELGDKETLAIVDAWQKTLVISGASAEEAASSTLQFSQALSKGKLDGDEFRSVLENNAEFANRLTAAVGGSRAALFKLAQDGKLQVSTILKALTGDTAELERQFALMPITVSRAGTDIKSALTRYVGQTDASLSATQRLAQGVEMLAANFDDVANSALIVAGALGAVYAAKGVVAIGAGAGRAAGPIVAATAAELEYINAVKSGAAVDLKSEQAAKLRAAAMLEGAQADAKATAAKIAEIEAAAAQNNATLALARSQLAEAEAVNASAQLMQRAGIPTYGRMAVVKADLINATRAVAAAEGLELALSAELTAARNAQAIATGRLAVAEEAAAAAALVKGAGGASYVAAAGRGALAALRGLVSFLGGPWVVALLAAGAAAWGLHKAIQAITDADERIAAMGDGFIANASEMATASRDRAAALREEQDALRNKMQAEVDAARQRIEIYRAFSQNDEFSISTIFLGLSEKAAADAERALDEITRKAEAAANAAQDLILPERIRQSYQDIANITDELKTAEGERKTYLEEQLRLKQDELARNKEIAQQRKAALEAEIAQAESLVNIFNLDPALLTWIASLREQLSAATDAATYTPPTDASSGTGKTPDQLRAEAELEALRLGTNQRLIDAKEDQIDLEKRIAEYVKAGQGDEEARASAQRDQNAIIAARNAAYGREVQNIRAAAEIEAARLAGDIDLERSLQRQLDIHDRTLDLMARGRTEEEARAEATETVNRLDAARHVAAQKNFTDQQRSLDLEIAQTLQNQAQVDRLSDETKLRELIQQYQEDELTKAQATAQAEQDLLRIQEARAEARRKSLADMDLEYRLSLAQARGDTELVRQLQNQQNAQRYSEQLRGLGVPREAADRYGHQMADAMTAATRQGEFREAFKSAFKDAINLGLQEGDWGSAALKFGADLAQHFADEALNKLADSLFNAIFGQFDAVAEGTAQGAAAGAQMAQAMLTAGHIVAGEFRSALSVASLGGAKGVGGAKSGGTAGTIFAAVSTFAGFLAEGGPALPGRSYIVGEDGPEVLQMGNLAGHVIPNHALNAAVSGGAEGGSRTYIDNSLTVQGSIDAVTWPQVQAQLAARDHLFGPAVDARVLDSQKRGRI